MSKNNLVIVLILIIIGMLYILLSTNSKQAQYVFACPDINSSTKCYRLDAKYDCEEGNCQVSNIQFPNQGLIEFWDCLIPHKEGKGSCWEIGPKDAQGIPTYGKEWYIELGNK